MTLHRLAINGGSLIDQSAGQQPVIQFDDQSGSIYVSGTLVSGTKLAGSISEFNPHADGVTDDTMAFIQAGTFYTEIWLAPGKKYFIGQNLTINSDLRFIGGSQIVAGAGAVITIKGTVFAGNDQQIFSFSNVFTQVASDNMTRANENPMSDGGNWVQMSGASNQGQLLSDLFQMTTTNTVSGVVWTGPGIGNDQYSSATINNAGGNNGNSQEYVMVRFSTHTQNPSNYNGYFAWVSGSGAGVNRYIYRYTNGVGVQLYTDKVTANNGDVLTLGVQGSTIVLFYNGVYVTSFVDPAPITSGAPGIALFDNNSLTRATISNWVGGNFSAQGTILFGVNDPFIYGEWFGAKGDGATNDAAAFQFAINALSGCGLGYVAPPPSPGGGTIVLLNKSYAISSTLNIAASWVNITGQGRRNSTLLWTGSAGIDVLFISGTGQTSTNQIAFNKFSDFMLTKSAGAGSPLSYVHITNAILVEFFRVDAIGLATNNFFADTSYYNMYFQDCLANLATNGFNLTSPGSFNSGRLLDCVTVGNTVGFNIQAQGGGAGIADLYLIRCEDAGSGIACKITSNASGVLGWSNDNVHLINCIFDNNSTSCLQVNNVYGDGAYIDFDSCYFASAASSSAPTIDIENSCVQLRGCDIRDASGTFTPQGLVLFNGLNCSGSIISNCQLVNVATGTIPFMIKLVGANNVVVQGNVFIGQASTEPFTNGIWLVGASKNAVTGNMGLGWGTTGLLYDASSNNNASTGNVVDTTHITTAKTDNGASNGAGI